MVTLQVVNSNCVPLIGGVRVEGGSAPDSVTANKGERKGQQLAQVPSIFRLLRRRAARIGDASHPAPVSRQSGQTPAAGSVGAPEYLSPMPSEHGSDDNSPRMSGGTGTGSARGTRLASPALSTVL